MDNTGGFNLEELIRLIYPGPVAVSYKKMDEIISVKEPFVKDKLLIELFEVILKYLSSILISQYLQEKRVNEQINQNLQSLARPSLGHWLSFLRDISNFYHVNGYELILPEIYDFYNKKNKSLVKSEECYKKIKEICAKDIQKEKGTVKTLFNSLLTYRNSWGHGASPEKADDVLERVKYIQPALEEILKEMMFVNNLKPGYVKEVSYTAKGLNEHIVVFFRGTDRKTVICEYKEDRKLEPGHIYLFTGNESLIPSFCLTPLIVYDSCHMCKREQFFFLNGAGKKDLEYLSYLCGHTVKSEKYFKYFREMIERLKETAELSQDLKLYQKKCMEVLEDGVIDDNEKIEIEELLILLDISKSKAFRLEEKVRKEMGFLDIEKVNIYKKILGNICKKEPLSIKYRELFNEKAKELGLPSQAACQIEGELYFKRGLSLKEEGNKEMALSFLKAAAELLPDCKEYREEYESLIKEKKEVEEEPEIPEDRKKAEELKEKGELLIKEGKYEEGIEYLDKALEVGILYGPICSKIWKKKAKVLKELGKEEEAITCLENALKC